MITIDSNHPAAEELGRLSALLRSQRRKENTQAPDGLHLSVNLIETNHGSRTATYTFLPGKASLDEAMESFEFLRKSYPFVVDTLCYAASQNKIDFTVEVATFTKPDDLSYSSHDLIHILPRILAIFRGTPGK